MPANFGTPKATSSIRGYAIPPVPSFRGGRLDTPAADLTAKHQRMFPSPQRLKVQAAVEKALHIQERIKAASSEKDEKIAEIEAIINEQSTLKPADLEARLRTATSGSTGADYRRRAQAWTCLAKLAQKQNYPERAISYLQEALVHKAQPKHAIEQALRDLYVENGGSISDLLSPPCDNDVADHNAMETTPVSTPITKRLQARLQEHDRDGDHVSAMSLQFGTPRAEKISLLRTDPAKPYTEEETPSPTPAQVVHLSELLEKAYIEGPPLNIQAKKENIPVKNPFDAADDETSMQSPVAEKYAKGYPETPDTARRVRRSLRLAKRLNY